LNNIKIHIAKFLATGFYSGLSPKAPGTCGTAAAALCIFLLLHLFPAQLTFSAILLFSVVTTVLGIFLSNFLLQQNVFSSNDAKKQKDPQAIVIDEFAGFFVTLCFAPVNEVNLLLAFALFRIFDIKKPFPVSYVEQYPDGYGIMADDVVAGLMAGVVLMLINTLL
jgi:phosphatidylglycerophosphatase A